MRGETRREMAEGGGLDQFLADLGTTDAKKKLTTGQVQASTFHNSLSKYRNIKVNICLRQNIINYLGDPAASIECEDTGSFVDQLVPWMQSSNFKVNINSFLLYAHLQYHQTPRIRFPRMG